MSRDEQTLRVAGMQLRLGAAAPAVAAARAALDEARAVSRVWARDHTLWRPEPDEIADRLGWLDSPTAMRPELTRLDALREAARGDGLDRALLMGMGGSSLAAEVYRDCLPGGADGLELALLDSTHPDALRAAFAARPPARSLYLAASKSGGTLETRCFLRRALVEAETALGEDGEAVGGHFVAITDPGSRLAEAARAGGFRALFVNDPNIGGRFSALSFFGLVPAALCGADTRRILAAAARAAEACGHPDGAYEAAEDPGAWLGAALGGLARAGRDKLTLVLPAALARFGDWTEQLLAESTGKEGRGILPVLGEPLRAPEAYGPDRLFLRLRLAGAAEPPGREAALEALTAAGHPLITIDLQDPHELGGQLFTWMMATALAGHLLDVQPFDQPDVESAKRAARAAMTGAGGARTAGGASGAPPGAAARRSGDAAGAAGAMAASEDDGTARSDADGDAGAAALAALVDALPARGYLALQAYLPPGAEMDEALDALRAACAARTKRPVTRGYGPRFLHSTGQLHKGDAGRGAFVQLLAPAAEDLAVDPRGASETAAGGEPPAPSFGVVLAAQALGDAEALREAGRPVLRLRLDDRKGGAEAAVAALARALAAQPRA